VAGEELLQMRGLERDAEIREALTGAHLLSLPVVFRSIELGRPVDLVVDLEGRRVLALEVSCRDGALRLLPLPAARITPDELCVGSPLTVLDEAHASFYRERGRPLRALRGAPVTRGKAELGVIEDVVVLADGPIVELVVVGRAGRRRVPFDDRLVVGGKP
jgi:hypothetical protein